MTGAAPSKSVHVIITGRVQGVGYRAWTARTAGTLGLTGWARNRRDGTVEAVFSGSTSAVDDMVERCRFGPRSAEVTGIKATPATGAFAAFAVRPTE